jgi:hypothetical protein
MKTKKLVYKETPNAPTYFPHLHGFPFDIVTNTAHVFKAGVISNVYTSKSY